MHNVDAYPRLCVDKVFVNVNAKTWSEAAPVILMKRKYSARLPAINLAFPRLLEPLPH